MNSEETPTAAFVLSLIAGVLILAGGTASMMMGAFMSGWGVWGGMMGGGMMPWWSGFGLALGAVGIAIGVLVIIAALMLNSRPLQHVTWGTLILVLSIVSVVGGWGGFGIGLILGVIGGALAISWKPSPARLPPQPGARFCSQCGGELPAGAKFCPQCGKAASQ
ncbi:MAG: zinc ribbon domain-containing protein [Candidatus Bathyarchaeia archaeon]